MFRSNLPKVTYQAADYQQQIYCSSIHYYEDLFKDIDQATQTIDMETFIFSDDVLAHRVAERLCSAAQRGVAVRLMIDGMGALLSDKLQGILIDAGVEFKIYHPAPWRFHHWRHSSFLGKRLFQRWIYFIAHANQRNHRKVVLIDNKIAWIGSINVTVQHLTEEAGGNNWHDTAVRLQDLDFRDLTLAFEAEFYSKHFQFLFKQPMYNRIFRLNNTRLRRRKIYHTLLRKLRRARKRIWITNAYFIPDKRILRALKEAAWIGVKVRIILPMRSNHPFMGWASSVFYSELLKAGVRIYEFEPGMLHSKAMIIDDWMMIGSSNLNSRSLFSDYEVDVILGSEKAQIDLQNQMVDFIQFSREIKLEEFEKYGRFRRLLGLFIMFFRRWL